tara:strand:- start:100 stop:1326 length:1227 start_codon:yes stop_codon:yes gene_type:complete
MSRYPFLGLGFYSWSNKFGPVSAGEGEGGEGEGEGGGGGDSSVAANKVVVGAYFDDDGGTSTGSVYVYDLDGTNEVKITASDRTAGDRFGQSVGLGTNKIAVGSPYTDPSGTSSGKVYLYNLSGTEVGIITASDGASSDLFGHSVAVGSNKIVVGVPGDDDTASTSGSVYVYDLDGTNEVKINASDAAADDQFGDVVAVGSNRIVVGVYRDDDDGTTSGSAYVYNLDGTNEVKITGSNSDAGDEFGHSVAVGANKVVIGAPKASTGGKSSGIVYVYDLDGTNEIMITPSDAANNDNFGNSVGIGTNKIVVGSPSDDDAGTLSGSAYVYNLDGTGEVKITASDAAAVDKFGETIAIGNNKIVVGAQLNDDDGASSGSVYVYDLDGTNEVKITSSDAAGGDQFGQSVAVG